MVLYSLSSRHILKQNKLILYMGGVLFKRNFSAFFYIYIKDLMRRMPFNQITDCSFWGSGLRKHDVCFLITVRPMQPYGTKFDRRQPFVEQTGLVYVRGCEIQGMLDEKGRVIEEGVVYQNLFKRFIGFFSLFFLFFTP